MMNVLIIPEDFRKDQYLLLPLFTRLFSLIGKPRARVRVCLDPLLGGVQEALKIENLRSIIDRYAGMIDVFLLCIDRDGQVGRRQKLDTIERNLGALCSFLSENAWEELETWTLAGLDLPRDWQWSEIRAEVSVKGRYFDILAIKRGVADGPGGGRKVLGEEAARRVDVIRQKCHEDFGSIAGRLEVLCAGPLL
jgi:hypothetical protein